jgi:hypothetical protein
MHTNPLPIPDPLGGMLHAQAPEQLLFLLPGLLTPLLERRSPAPGSRFLMWPRMRGTSVVGRSLQRGLVTSISPTQRMPYLSR